MASSRKSRKRKNPESNWIPESRNFFTDVINDTLQSLGNDDMLELSRTERMSLANLKKLWMEKYDPRQRMPEASPVPCFVLNPAAQRAQKKKKTVPKSAPDEHYVDMNTLDDDTQVIYRIQVPRLRAEWPQCRSFDLKVAARVCKSNLIQSLINWELLDSIMQIPLDEATALFQSCVDDMLEESQHDECANSDIM